MRSASVTSLMAARGHEQVVFVADRDAGLRALIAVHSTVLGPSLGGVRFWRYESEQAALADALALSEAMTLKAAVAGLRQGGGKAVVMWDVADRPRPRRLLHALGRAIDGLGGRYLAAEDVGATTDDMDGLAEVTPYVTGRNEANGGSGDPSPVTAVGVFAGMRAALRAVDGDATLAERRVVVQGAGHVGSYLSRLLVDAGATVVVSDLDPRRADALAADLGVETVAHEVALWQPCDVLAPCALGGVLDERTIPQLQCRAIVGAANNQLGVIGADRALAARGILYAPDFVVNAGGIINIAQEFVGYDRARALVAAEAVGDTLTSVLESARADGVTPLVAAERLARERIAAPAAAP
jgi:leucine dehydrogenase